MSYRIVILDEAKIDYQKSFNWYNNINPKLAKRFHLSFKESISILRKNPQHFQIRYDDVRVIMLTTFPYLIHYTINKEKIIIKAIFHSSKDSELNVF